MLPFEMFFKDLKHSLRMFARSRAFTAAAIAALTLGIGANTAIFSVVNAVLLRPVAFPDPDRLVVFTSPGASGTGASPAKFQHYRQQSSVTGDASAYRTGVVNYTGGSFPEQLRSGQVSADFFRLFGARTALGRTFSQEEDLPTGERVAVLSNQLWMSRFNRDPNVIGKTVSLSGDTYNIIGVLGAFTFDEFGPAPQVWIPFKLDPNAKDQGHYFQVAGRLKPGVTLDQALGRRLQARVPELARKQWQLQRRAHSGRARQQRPFVAARAGRRRHLRAAHRLRQRGQSAPRARDRPPP